MTRRLFALVCLLLAAGFTALGVWQLERRAWKLDLIARVEARIHAPPRLLTDLSGLSDADAYRRVRQRIDAQYELYWSPTGQKRGRQNRAGQSAFGQGTRHSPYGAAFRILSENIAPGTQNGMGAISAIAAHA